MPLTHTLLMTVVPAFIFAGTLLLMVAKLPPLPNPSLMAFALWMPYA
jgi:hypothetical protein